MKGRPLHIESRLPAPTRPEPPAVGPRRRPGPQALAALGALVVGGLGVVALGFVPAGRQHRPAARNPAPPGQGAAVTPPSPVAPPSVPRAVAASGTGHEVDGVIRTVVPSDGGGPVVALTFDDGPDPTWTPQVLQILHDAGIHATFCLVGRAVRRHPDLVRAILEAGNTLCDHTQGHTEHLDRRPLPFIEAEVGQGREAIVDAAGQPPRFYRAPGGSLSAAVIDVAHRDGMAVLGWSLDPRDWKHPPAAAILDYILAGIRPGAVVLLHDGGGDRSSTVAQLPSLIGELTRRGYRFVVPT